MTYKCSWIVSSLFCCFYIFIFYYISLAILLLSPHFFPGCPLDAQHSPHYGKHSPHVSIHTHTHTHTHPHTHTHTHTLSHTHTHTHIDRQTDRQTHTDTHRHTHRTQQHTCCNDLSEVGTGPKEIRLRPVNNGKV